mmetsp:Transcript_4687/g.9907  ORF Transcript_4687/g.9907 Transcript_4687/m.9907 type:complete len:114 (-) Transcript_4687:46-387(-)
MSKDLSPPAPDSRTMGTREDVVKVRRGEERDGEGDDEGESDADAEDDGRRAEEREAGVAAASGLRRTAGDLRTAADNFERDEGADIVRAVEVGGGAGLGRCRQRESDVVVGPE